MENIACCSCWEECCLTGECTAPEYKPFCATAKNMSRGINFLKKGELLLIDGNNFLYRAFYAYPPMTGLGNVPTNAVYGTLRMLESLIPKVKPTHLAVCFDASRESFRNRLYKNYKGNRKGAPPELIPQFNLIREVLKALNILYLESPEYEADDLIGTVAQKAAGYLTRIATGDRDCLQMINHRIRVLYYRKGGYIELTPEMMEQEFGYPPHHVVPLKALAGDTSDNIHGAPGIGEKTALNLIRQHINLTKILAVEIPGKTGEIIKEYAEDIRLSQKLATIKCDCPLPLGLDDLKLNIDEEKGSEKLLRLGIKSINLSKFTAKAETQTPEETRRKEEIKPKKSEPELVQMDFSALFGW
ncbi:MAG: DNA polymerase I [Pelotomaculum sp. PtaB.Bin104]|nr:MAG: DNA polymerase I [Pelotomaculum sp. PtaB.Bin104]